MLEQLSINLAQFIKGDEFSPILLLISFLGGILSSISPCSLGMLPLIIGYVGGYGDSNKFKTFILNDNVFFLILLIIVLTLYISFFNCSLLFP